MLTRTVLLLTSLQTGFALPDFTEAVNAVKPALVSILADRVLPGPDSGAEAARTLGSGFVIDTLGHILTCNHVVAGYHELTIKFADGISCSDDEVVVVGRDPVTDLAIVRVRPERRYAPAQLGNSDDLEVGQWVLALGSPYGLQGSASAGIVSGLSRWGLAKTSGPDFQDFIQTDALINPGNSGGPLVDTEGRVVGVASFTKMGENDFTGIGFCVPINLAMEVATELIRYGGVVRGYLGVNTQPLTRGLRRALALETRDGVLVSSVATTGPAAQAGIEPGDVIVELDSMPVRDVRSFQREVAARKPGGSVRLALVRRNQRIETTITLGAWPIADIRPRSEPSGRLPLGLAVRDLAESDKVRTGVSKGVFVDAVDAAGPAYDAGVRPGDVIVQADFVPVVNTASFEVAASKPGSRPILLRIWRGRTAFYVAVER
uniref:PDZ domain-containing protein n=1 Tax=candidate division WOR-3 bacterium TaxID=2052148 RepID=A0A7C4CDI2_UNCW3